VTAKFSIGFTVLVCACAWGADIHALDVKPGQWETTTTGLMTGMPSIPPEVLNQMTPEQRAKVQSAMGARGAKPMVSTGCKTKEKLEQAWNSGQEALKACTISLTTSTSSKQEIHMDCNRDGAKSSGTVKVEAIDSEHIRGSIQMTANTGDEGHTMNMNYTFTSKWLGACTEK
jgi:Protein of unknown function (DUF3617)